MSPVPPFLATTPPPVPVPSSERIAALYAFTRAQRDSNPTGYASNVKWWSDAIAATLRNGWAGALSDSGRDVLLLKVDNALLERYENALGGRPRGIGGVVDSLSTGTGLTTLVPLQRYQDTVTPLEAGPSIASRLVGAGWSALGRISPFSGGEATEEQLWKACAGREFVHSGNVKAAAQKFSEHITAYPPVNFSDSLYTRSGFHREFAKVAAPGGTKGSPLTQRDVDLLLRWLERDAGSIVLDGNIVKILSAGQIAAQHPINDADRGAVSITDALAKIDAQILSVEAEAAQCQAKAKRQLSLGQRAAAASYLRSKRQLDDVLTKRVAAGEQLRTVLRSLDQAKSDAEVMSAYEASTAALATTLADPRLSPDRIAATTDALADVLADQKEIDDAVQLGGKLAAGAAGVETDDDELERELAALVLEEKEAQIERAKAEAERRAAAKAEADRVAAQKAEADKAAAAAKAPAAVKAAEVAALKAVTTPPDSWAERHASAQEREQEEKARAEAERLKREERYVPAE